MYKISNGEVQQDDNHNTGNIIDGIWLNNIYDYSTHIYMNVGDTSKRLITYIHTDYDIIKEKIISFISSVIYKKKLLNHFCFSC